MSSDPNFKFKFSPETYDWFFENHPIGKGKTRKQFSTAVWQKINRYVDVDFIQEMVTKDLEIQIEKRERLEQLFKAHTGTPVAGRTSLKELLPQPEKKKQAVKKKKSPAHNKPKPKRNSKPPPEEPAILEDGLTNPNAEIWAPPPETHTDDFVYDNVGGNNAAIQKEEIYRPEIPIPADILNG